MRTARTLLATLATTGLLAPALTIGLTTAAHADGESCDGQAATQVVGPGSGSVVEGTDGEDIVVITTTSVVTYDAKGGNDVVCAGPRSLVLGGDGSDVILASPSGERLEADGMSGDDTMTGGSGNDLLFGGDGNDTLAGNDGADNLIGNSGDDHVSGGPGNDHVSGARLGGGGAGDERFPSFFVTSDPGVDDVAGGAGDDYVVDSVSDETLAGGDGADTLALNADYGADTETNCGSRPPKTPHPVVDVGTHTVSGFGDDTFVEFERYQGGEYDATLVGSHGPDVLDAGICGTVVIKGRGGSDLITSSDCGFVGHGGPGADQIVATGAAVASGGDGGDTFTWGGFGGVCSAPVSFEGDRGRDELVLTAQAADWRIVNLARGTATGANDAPIALGGIEDVHLHGRPFGGKPGLLVGTRGPNRLVGGSGRTAIRGLGGNDTLIGGGGRDTTYGGPGRDTCRAEVRHQCERRPR
jgi:Ca2+-binding RTX toxin-like protein